MISRGTTFDFWFINQWQIWRFPFASSAAAGRVMDLPRSLQRIIIISITFLMRRSGAPRRPRNKHDAEFVNSNLMTK